MALVFSDSTKCLLCDKVLIEQDEVIVLPASSSVEHYLYKYFDCGFHKICFDKWDKKEEIKSIMVDEMQNFKQSNYFKEMSAKYGVPKYLQ